MRTVHYKMYMKQRTDAAAALDLKSPYPTYGRVSRLWAMPVINLRFEMGAPI